jgi:hypothetical protein
MKFFGLFFILTISQCNQISPMPMPQDDDSVSVGNSIKNTLSEFELFLIRLFDLDEKFFTRKAYMRNGYSFANQPTQSAKIDPKYLAEFQKERMRREKLRLLKEREDSIYRLHLARRIHSSFRNDFLTMRY